MSECPWRSALLLLVLVALVAGPGCIAPSRQNYDALTSIRGFTSPSIELVEWEENNPPPHIPEALSAHIWCVIRVCDLEAAPAKYEELTAAFFDNFTIMRLFVGRDVAHIEVEPRSSKPE